MAHIFETKSCGRCGGSGNYSFNLMHGSRCYGCGGSGVVLSKRGLAARNYYMQSMKKQLKDIQVGDYILCDTSMFGGPSRWHKVEEIKKGDVCRIVNGVPDTVGVYTIVVSRKGKVTNFCGYRLEYEFQCVKNDEELNAHKAAALAHQATLNEKGKPKKIQAQVA